VPWGAAGRVLTRAETYSKEFRGDVMAVTQRREARLTIKQIAKHFGISETCLRNWLRRAEIEAGPSPGPVPRELSRRDSIR